MNNQNRKNAFMNKNRQKTDNLILAYCDFNTPKQISVINRSRRSYDRIQKKTSVCKYSKMSMQTHFWFPDQAGDGVFVPF